MRITISRAELPEQQDRLDDEAGVVALVQVEAALERGDRHAGETSRGAAGPRDPGAVATGQPGRSSNGMATGSSRSSARLPSPEPEHDADTRHEVRAGADGSDERGEAGGLLGRGDRTGSVDGRVMSLIGRA